MMKNLLNTQNLKNELLAKYRTDRHVVHFLNRPLAILLVLSIAFYLLPSKVWAQSACFNQAFAAQDAMTGGNPICVTFTFDASTTPALIPNSIISGDVGNGTSCNGDVDLIYMEEFTSSGITTCTNLFMNGSGSTFSGNIGPNATSIDLHVCRNGGEPMICNASIMAVCDLVVTCPSAALGTISCNQDAATVFPPANDEASFEALGGDIDDDFCTSLSVSSMDNVVGDCCSGGTITRTYTISDAVSSTTCTQTITFALDNIPPTLSCPMNQTEDADASCSFTLPDYTGQATVSDNCPNPMVSQSPAAGQAIGLGETTVTLTAIDGSDNEVTCTFTVTVKDNTAPVAPDDLADATFQCLADVMSADMTALDNCDGNITVSPVDIITAGTDPTCPNNVTIERTWTFIDACMKAQLHK